MVTYWGSTADTALFFLAVKFSAAMNGWTAGFSGLSALCVGVHLFIR